MAGIAGMVCLTDDILQKSVNICAMSEAIRSRGASGAGHYISPHAVFLRRTGLIGQTGKGSFVSEVAVNGKTYILALDGTIFNRSEISSDLNLSGVDHNVLSCSELLVYAYVKWKEDFLKN